MTIRNTFRRGFTLIELMIVIVILGILMGTLLPRLTGAQSRARDVARKADLGNIALALEAYASDFGKYPDALCTGCTKNNCLDVKATGTDDTYNLLKGYMKGEQVPQNVAATTITIGCEGSYYYSPLKKGGASNQAYVLASDVETWQQANFETGSPPETSDFSSEEDISTVTASLKKLTAESDSALRSILVVAQ